MRYSKKTYFTSEDWRRWDSKLRPRDIGTLTCYHCNSSVDDTLKDARGVELPYCRFCGLFYQPKWVFTFGRLGIIIEPRTKDATYTDHGEIPHDTTQQRDTATQQYKETQQYTDETPENKAPQHKDVKGQILALVPTIGRITKADLKKHIDASRQSIDVALKKLIAENKITQIEKRAYQRIE